MILMEEKREFAYLFFPLELFVDFTVFLLEDLNCVAFFTAN